MDIVETLVCYYKKFKGEKGYIGKTELGEDIPFFVVKKTTFPVIIAQYAIHAREHITTLLALKQINYFMRYGKKGKVYFIPAVNIDGINICKLNPLYKANARGVDLNVNFDARWGTGISNKSVKGDSDYIGEYPFSEAETKALRDFTLAIKPNATISYHCKGEEIYYLFFQSGEDLIRDEKIATAVSKVTGYAVKPTPFSAGGYKDWCIESLKIPALTIEVGEDSLCHPLGKEHLNSIFRKNRRVINVITETMYEH